MSTVSDEQIVDGLARFGVPLDNHFVLPTGTRVGDTDGLIGFWHPEVGFRYLVIENDALAAASYRFLVARGNRRFDPGVDIWATAEAERWPGWDTCADAVRARDAVRLAALGEGS